MDVHQVRPPAGATMTRPSSKRTVGRPRPGRWRLSARGLQFAPGRRLRPRRPGCRHAPGSRGKARPGLPISGPGPHGSGPDRPGRTSPRPRLHRAATSVPGCPGQTETGPPGQGAIAIVGPGRVPRPNPRPSPAKSPVIGPRAPARGSSPRSRGGNSPRRDGRAVVRIPPSRKRPFSRSQNHAAPPAQGRKRKPRILGHGQSRSHPHPDRVHHHAPPSRYPSLAAAKAATSAIPRPRATGWPSTGSPFPETSKNPPDTTRSSATAMSAQATGPRMPGQDHGGPGSPAAPKPRSRLSHGPGPQPGQPAGRRARSPRTFPPEARQSQTRAALQAWFRPSPAARARQNRVAQRPNQSRAAGPGRRTARSSSGKPGGEKGRGPQTPRPPASPRQAIVPKSPETGARSTAPRPLRLVSPAHAGTGRGRSSARTDGKNAATDILT
jgi:hypothetical protein